MNYDVIIIGAGPAGLFAAYKLKKSIPGASVLLLDYGNEESGRECTVLKGGVCGFCDFCHMTGGFGGAGLFSDGKLCLDLRVGGHENSLGLDGPGRNKLVKEVESILHGFDGESEKKIPNKEMYYEMGEKAKKIGFGFNCYPVRHFASRRLFSILKRLREEGLRGIEMKFGFKVQTIKMVSDHYFDIKIIGHTIAGLTKTFHARNLVIAVGKMGSGWASKTLSMLGAQIEQNRIFIGFRIETKQNFLKKLFDVAYNPKFEQKLPDNTKMKTHCFCRNGRILLTRYNGYPVVGGDTPSPGRGQNANFAILMREPFAGSISQAGLKTYMDHINKLGVGNLLIQRLEDFRRNRSSTLRELSHNSIVPTALHISKPCNLRLLKTPFNYDTKLLDFLSKLDYLFPGIACGDNLLYAPAVEWWMPRVEIEKGTMRTSLRRVYAIGDGAGISQGIVFAAATGLLAAQSIAKELLTQRHKCKKIAIHH